MVTKARDLKINIYSITFPKTILKEEEEEDEEEEEEEEEEGKHMDHTNHTKHMRHITSSQNV